MASFTPEAAATPVSMLAGGNAANEQKNISEHKNQQQAPIHTADVHAADPTNHPYAIPGSASAATGGTPWLLPKGGLLAPASGTNDQSGARGHGQQPQWRSFGNRSSSQNASRRTQDRRAYSRSRSARSSSLGASSAATNIKLSDGSGLTEEQRSAIGTFVYKYRHDWKGLLAYDCGLITAQGADKAPVLKAIRRENRGLDEFAQ